MKRLMKLAVAFGLLFGANVAFAQYYDGPGTDDGTGFTVHRELELYQMAGIPAPEVLRMATLGGLFGLASGAIAGLLPPGVGLDGERILVDLRAIAAQRGVAELFDYLGALRIRSEAGRILVHVDAGVGG